MKKITFYILLLLIGINTKAQQDSFNIVTRIYQPDADYYQIVNDGQEYFTLHPDTSEDGEEQAFTRWANMWRNRVSTDGSISSFTKITEAYQNLLVNPVCNGSTDVPSQWNFLGPVSLPTQSIGMISAVAALPTEPGTIYAGSSNGGLFRTTNYTPGSTPTWTNLTDQQRLPACGVRSIIIDPDFIPQTNYHTLYIAYGQVWWNTVKGQPNVYQ